MRSTTVQKVAAYGLAAFFVFIGAQKFGAENPIFALIAERSGLSLFEPFIRVAVGVAELVAAGLLAFGATRLFGAVLGLGLLLGAIGFHLSPWLGVVVPVPVEAPIGGGLFVAALLFTALNAFVLYGLRAEVGSLLGGAQTVSAPAIR